MVQMVLVVQMVWTEDQVAVVNIAQAHFSPVVLVRALAMDSVSRISSGTMRRRGRVGWEQSTPNYYIISTFQILE